MIQIKNTCILNILLACGLEESWIPVGFIQKLSYPRSSVHRVAFSQSHWAVWKLRPIIRACHFRAFLPSFGYRTMGFLILLYLLYTDRLHLPVSILLEFPNTHPPVSIAPIRADNSSHTGSFPDLWLKPWHISSRSHPAAQSRTLTSGRE